MSTKAECVILKGVMRMFEISEETSQIEARQEIVCMPKWAWKAIETHAELSGKTLPDILSELVARGFRSWFNETFKIVGGRNGPGELN